MILGVKNFVRQGYMARSYTANLIVAFDKKFGISKNNQIPWHITEDVSFFQDVTTRKHGENKNVVIMGRNSWCLTPDKHRSLKDRTNIIISNTLTPQEIQVLNKTEESTYLTTSLTNAFEICDNINPGKVFICGGMGIYEEACKNHFIDEIYVTEIDRDYECDNNFGDGYFLNLKNAYELMSDDQFKVCDHLLKEMVDIKVRKYCHPDVTKEKISNVGEMQYLNLLRDIIQTGHLRSTRNANVYSVFGKHMEFDLSKGFPLLTTKRVFLRGIFEETKFFLSGKTDAGILSRNGVKVWDGNTSREFLDSMGLKYDVGDMGPMYPFQYRFFGLEYDGMNQDYNGKGGFDQVKYCLDTLKKDPFSRRIMMTSFNPQQASQGVLYPCHSIVLQFYVEKNNELSMACYNRSQDVVLGVVWNMTYASLLVYLFCEVINNDPEYKGTKLTPGRLIMNLGDTHIYENHYSQAIRQILREPYSFPKLSFNRPITNFENMAFDDLKLENYVSYPNIKADMIP